jgi:SAM-dependent methyltransferase
MMKVIAPARLLDRLRRKRNNETQQDERSVISDSGSSVPDPETTGSPGIQLPPPHLRYRVAGTDAGDWFVESGEKSLRDLERALASVRASYEDFNDILEWGCGCGRILRHLPVPVSPRKLYGNEIDAEAIAWISAHMPWVETSLTDGKPPLPYDDGAFDLIFNHSVMSHLDVDYQDAWLAELARVLRPGGVVTLTVHGQHAFDQFHSGIPVESPLRQQVADTFHTRGLYYTKDDQWAPDFPDFYHSAFHSVGYIFDHWSKFLRVCQYIPRGALDYQDMVVLRKLE